MVVKKFGKVEYQALKVGKCKCGVKRKRQKMFYQTENPFNRNDDGSIKTRKQIRSELLKSALKWEKEPITCEKCK